MKPAASFAAVGLGLALVAGPVSAEGTAFPIAAGGPFVLTDGTGTPRSEADPEGRMQLLFFGYANCDSICDVALPAMADAADALAAAGVPARPVMITIDPERDTVDTIAAPLRTLHPDFVGLTGTERELAPVWDAFGIERSVVFEDPYGNPVYAHGSFVYLLDGAGAVQTVLPPILSPERIAEIALTYAD